MKTHTVSGVAGVVLVLVAIATSLVLGTAGWFGLGFGIMTDCTNQYSCTETGCSPCATTERWINLGGVTQLLLAVAGVVLLWRRCTRRPHLLTGGATLLAASVLTVVGTTWLAQESYCRPGTAGYDASYCTVDD